MGFDHLRHLWCTKGDMEIVLSEMKDEFYFSLSFPVQGQIIETFKHTVGPFQHSFVTGG